MTQADDLAARIAWTMEIDVRLLPLLPELLADLTELGTPVGRVVDALASAGLGREATVLDLGCGKGAVAVALAQRLGVRVEGVDGLDAFVEAARALAGRSGVSELCQFRQGDLLSELLEPASYDAVLLLSVGPLLGDHRTTLRALRTKVRRGGLVVIAAGFLAEGVGSLPGYDGYAPAEETRCQLATFGDALVLEAVTSSEETHRVNLASTESIRRRAERLASLHPELAPLLDAYVARQEIEVERLATDFVCTLWVLRRA